MNKQETIKPAQQPEPSEVCETYKGGLGDKAMQRAWMLYADAQDVPHDHEDEEPFKYGYDAGRTDKPATPPASEPSRDAMVELINNEWVKYINDTGGRKVEEWFADFCLDQLAHFAGQRAEVAALKIALADAIRCPMGVCPDSAVGLLTVEELKDAENRRIEGKSPAIKHIGLTGEAK